LRHERVGVGLAPQRQSVYLEYQPCLPVPQADLVRARSVLLAPGAAR
jgi:hypothetical protein